MNRQLSNCDRRASYQLLATLFNYPEQSLLEMLPETLDEFADFFDLPLPEELSPLSDLTSLEVAYTGLFINRLGGAPAPPYGSIYLESTAQLMGASCLQVAEFYHREGLNAAASDEPADFLATELEFLYFLIDAEEQAVAAGDLPAVQRLQQTQADFFQKLLSPWLPEFCRRIAANAEQPLYLWAGRLLECFTEQERTLFLKREQVKN